MKRFRGKSEMKSKKDFTPRNQSLFSEETNKYIRDESNDQMRRLKEKDVGITEYLSEHEGFNGIIKQRYSDFHVNEIDCDGKLVILTNMEPPDVIDCEVEIPNEIIDLQSIISLELFEKIKALSEKEECNADDVEIEVTEMNKEKRKDLHSAIRAMSGGRLVSNTKEKEGKKFMIVSRHDCKVKQERRRIWPIKYGGDYVHFVLHKHNLDTMDAVNVLANKLRIKPNMINYAGTKDRRGMTSQMMSIWHVDPKKLANLNKFSRGLSLGNFCFKPKGLKLGDLQGNRFRIVLRNVTGGDQQIEQAMQSLTENGFLNYYGLQRFGNCVEVPTHAVGRALLQGDWKLAVELILKPRDGEQNRDLVKARKIWWETRDASQALEVLSNKEKLIEGKLLMGLNQCGSNDYVNALEKIPRNTRLLYLHSYQSLIWNKIVSRRVRELGLKPIVGDLVFLNDPPVSADVEDVLENEEIEISESVGISKKIPVKIITEKDLDSVHTKDIVMSLPGHDVVYPQNVMKDWYEELLKEDGLSSACLKQSVRKYSVSGTYRKMVILPDKVRWRTIHYSDALKTLELSDRERMNNEKIPKDEPNGIYKALLLDFCLPSSVYATMALREVLKSDTSAEHQASLNNYHAENTNITSESSEEQSAGGEPIKSFDTELIVKASNETRILLDENNENSNNMEIDGEVEAAVTDENASEETHQKNEGNNCDNQDKDKVICSDDYNTVPLGNDVESKSDIITQKRDIYDDSKEVEEKRIKLS